MEQHGIKPIDMVVVNLYPFAETIRRPDNRAEAIEQIDIGGPAMIRLRQERTNVAVSYQQRATTDHR